MLSLFSSSAADEQETMIKINRMTSDVGVIPNQLFNDTEDDYINNKILFYKLKFC